jgi:hypothetical protein
MAGVVDQPPIHRLAHSTSDQINFDLAIFAPCPLLIDVLPRKHNDCRSTPPLLCSARLFKHSAGTIYQLADGRRSLVSDNPGQSRLRWG